MLAFDWGLQLVLVGLLAITLVHAVRLERALRSMREDRAALGEAISTFDSSTRQAELGINRMQGVANDAAEMIGRRVDRAERLKDDLLFLVERGDGLADRLEALVRSGKAFVQPIAAPVSEIRPAAPLPAELQPKVRSQAERDLLLALRGVQ